LTARWTPADGLRLRDPVPVTAAWVSAVLTHHAISALGPAGLLTGRTSHERIAAGGQYLPMIERGAVWRLWTSIFVHVDLVHLLSNAVALWVLGRVLEPMIGGWRLSAWIFAGGVAGSIAAHLAGHLQSDGASGGAFALLGAAVVLGWRFRKELPTDDARTLGPVLGVFLVVNLVLSAVLPFVDLIGHLGGLAAGVVLAFAPGIRRGRVLRALDVGWVLGSIAICAYGFTRVVL
jgi:membrane associated rhomboid family serine protease